MQIEQVMQRAERTRVSQTMTRQERLKEGVFLVAQVIVIELGHVEVLLCMVELVTIVIQVPLAEVLLEPQSTALEWLVIAKREYILFRNSCINDAPPCLLIFRLSEEQVVDHVEHTWVVKLLVCALRDSRLEGSV